MRFAYKSILCYAWQVVWRSNRKFSSYDCEQMAGAGKKKNKGEYEALRRVPSLK
jgi:hypothetical protein